MSRPEEWVTTRVDFTMVTGMAKEEQLHQMSRQLRLLRLMRLLRLKQGNKTNMEFLRQAEEQAKLFCTNERPITVDEFLIWLGLALFTSLICPSFSVSLIHF
jgi:hypothetical protein